MTEVSSPRRFAPHTIMPSATALRAEREAAGLPRDEPLDIWPEFQRNMTQWILDGAVKWRETIVDGLENTPAAIIDSFAGKNIGKMLVRLPEA